MRNNKNCPYYGGKKMELITCIILSFKSFLYLLCILLCDLLSPFRVALTNLSVLLRFKYQVFIIFLLLLLLFPYLSNYSHLLFRSVLQAQPPVAHNKENTETIEDRHATENKGNPIDFVSNLLLDFDGYHTASI